MTKVPSPSSTYARKGKKKLRQILKDDLLIQVNEIWRKGELYQDFQKGDTIQGKLHCNAVESNLDKLIPDIKKENELKQIELFVLSAAACLHDIGKVIDDNKKGWKSDHGTKSMEIILKEYDKLGLERGQAVAVGYIVSTHGNQRLEDLPKSPIAIGSEEINIIELAAIFCLADILDTNYQRAPEILNKIKFPDGNIPSKWRGRQSITGWYLDEKNRIILQAIPKKDEIDSAYTLKAMMNEDLAKISPYLKLYGYPSEFGKLEIGDFFLKSELKVRARLQKPFPGMAFYTKDDAKIFKGREKETENLLSIISNWPITLLIGESGAGKTSLIHAGLFPKLEIMGWKFVWTRPFDNPQENIKKMILSTFFKGEIEPRKSLLDVMKEAAKKCMPRQLLVIIDQFEDMLNCSIKEIIDDFSLILMAIQTGTIIPNLRILISFREDALVKLNSRLLKKITGSAQQFPSVELERLTRDGARDALLSGLKNAGFGLDPRQKIGQKKLIEIILDDIQNGDDRIYPPYLQMVAEKLCKKVDQNNPIITREIYLEQLKGADNIIAHYLIDSLNEFSSQQNKVEQILINLTNSSGKKTKKNLDLLIKDTGIDINELNDIIRRMIDLRIVRYLGDNEIEIIHDYLSEIIDNELVNEELRTIKFLEEQLSFYSNNYKIHGTPILSSPFLVSLYKNRNKVRIKEDEYPVLLCTCFLEYYGLGWYWFKNIDEKKLFLMIKEVIYHQIHDIREGSIYAFIHLAKPEYRDIVINMLNDDNKFVRGACVRVLAKIGKYEDKNLIISMINDDSIYVQEKALKAFLYVARYEDIDLLIEYLYKENNLEQMIIVIGELANIEDRVKIINLLNDKKPNIRDAAVRILGMIAYYEDKEKIIEMTNDTDGFVRWGAVRALSKLAKSEDFNIMYNMLNDEYINVRGGVERILKNIANKEHKEKLISMLYNPKWYIREISLKILKKLIIPEDKDIIIMMMNDKNEVVRKEAIRTFKKIATQKDKDKLIEMLYDANNDVREATILVLIDILSNISEDQINLMLSHENRYIRKTALMILGEKSNIDDREKIIRMMKDDDEEIRKISIITLDRLKHPENKDKIINMLHDKNLNVRRTAIWILRDILKPKDQEIVLNLLANKSQGWSENQLNYLELLSLLDFKLYCPYHEKIYDFFTFL